MGQYHMDTVIVEHIINFFHQNQVALLYSGSDRGASHPSVLVLSSESSLLMAMLQVVAGVLHLAKGLALVSNEVM